MNPIVLSMQLMIVISLLYLVATTTSQQLTSHSKEQITVSLLPCRLFKPTFIRLFLFAS